MTSDEQGSAAALWEQARQFLQEGHMIWYCLRAFGSPRPAGDGRPSSETWCLLPLRDTQEEVGILRLQLRGIFPHTIEDAGEALLQTEAFPFIRDLATALLHQRTRWRELVAVQVQQQREPLAETVLTAVSHGFKTPLTALLLIAENWLGEAHLSTEQQSSLLLERRADGAPQSTSHGSSALLSMRNEAFGSSACPVPA